MRVQSHAAGASADDLNLVLWSWSADRPARVVLIDDEGRLSETSEVTSREFGAEMTTIRKSRLRLGLAQSRDRRTG